jgi:hypothetical protein
MRDLRKDMTEILNKYGHQIVYIRQDKRFRCDCYSERSGEARADCPKCFGTTYKVKIEKHLTRRKVSTVPETLPGVRKTSGGGMVVPTTYQYYLLYDVEPQRGDLILEVEWQDDIPRAIKEKLAISLPDPKQGATGRIEFWQVYVRTDWKGAEDNAALTQS